MPELHWLGDDDAKRAARRVSYRLLEPIESVGDPASGNWLIQGDNLEALKALMPFYAGRVKCIFIDPPYNTKSAFEHYDDNLEHSQWLSMMYPRLELLRDLLAEDGSIWVTIDDNEGHYLKVVMDEVFGRRNFVAANVWQKRYSRDNNSAIGDVHDYVLCYARKLERFKETRNRIAPDARTRSAYRNPTNDPKGPWRLVPMSGAELRPNQQYPITTPSGKVIHPPPGRHWSVLEDKFNELVRQGRVSFGKDGNSAPGLIRYLSEVEGLVPWTWWPHEDVGHTDESKKEIIALFGAEASFHTPKPERLAKRILGIATNEGELVLDSFMGSGTTAAVAHKMNRQWIGIEMGAHARTHCFSRLEKVVEGEQGGISESVNWKGGGGFKFLKLGAPAFNPDGRINPDIRFATLAAYIWFLETGAPHPTGKFDSPLLGTHNGNAIILLYNGILGDRRPEGGNVLTQAVWKAIVEVLPPHKGQRTIYGEASRLSQGRLKQLNASFLQIPYDIRMR